MPLELDFTLEPNNSFSGPDLFMLGLTEYVNISATWTTTMGETITSVNGVITSVIP